MGFQYRVAKRDGEVIPFVMRAIVSRWFASTASACYAKYDAVCTALSFASIFFTAVNGEAMVEYRIACFDFNDINGASFDDFVDVK